MSRNDTIQMSVTNDSSALFRAVAICMFKSEDKY